MMKAFLLAATALAVPIAVHAQTAGTTDDGGKDGYHRSTPSDIIVTAPFARNISEALSGTSILSDQQLTRALKPTIGETLEKLPGVSASSFGPSASRPILRGFQGERVRVLTDGIGSFDVSNTSVDHAVVINPLTAKRIEVLRGPAALLYGSSAIGGVVNVVDGRIPSQLPDEPIHVDAIATYGSAANERSVAGAADAPVYGKVVLHVDGSYTKSGDLDIGGHVLTPALQAQARASGDPDIAALADLKGTLPNTAARTWDVGAGAAIVTDTGNLGFSISHYDSVYGVPIRYSLSPDEESEKVRLRLKQTRADLRGEVDTGGGFLDKVRLRAGFATYRHAEIEDTGAIGTQFFNKSEEGRVEFVQADRGGWRGAFGGQLFIRDFNVVGEEAFLPKNETQQYGLFTLQEFDVGPVKLEAGGRYEHTSLSSRARTVPSEDDADLALPAYNRTFNAFSGSFGGSIAVTDGWRAGLSGSHTERAPSAEELFAFGGHAGTQAFEIGDPGFGKEKSNGVEATVHGKGSGYTLNLSAYQNWFSNYIYDDRVDLAVPENGDNLPVYLSRQAKARYYGFEIDGTATLARAGDWTFVADGLADFVHAQIVSTGPAPRIPPLRVLGGVEAQSEKIDGRVEVEWVDDQKRVSAVETPTEGYTLVNASLSFRPWGAASKTSILLSANNIFDVDARRHSSFLKDYAPLAGRDIRITARLSL